MNDTDRETLSRLLTEHGTSGVAEELAALCDERVEDDPDAGWEHAAARFRSIA